MSGGWKFAGSSVIGTSHLKDSEGICQDSHHCIYEPSNSCLICVVSDGAGSAARAEIGSRIACEVAGQSISQAESSTVHTKELAYEVLEAIRMKLMGKAKEEGRFLRDFACTLLVAISSPEGTSFWQIGDGAMCFRLPGEDGFKYAFWPEKGEYANVTYFVTDKDAASRMEFDHVDSSVEDLALFSDGLERLALDFSTGEAHTKFFTGFFPHLYREKPGHLLNIEASLQDFLNSDRVNSKTDDDKTLILATVAR